MSLRALVLASLLVAPGRSGLPAAGQEPTPERPTLVLRQAAPANVVGDDDVAIEAALKQLRKTGGTLVLGPGRYVVRRQIELPKNLVLRGEEGAILRLPSPVLTAAPAAAGSSELVLADAHEFAASVIVQVLPPVGSELFPDGKTKALELQWIERVEGARLALRDALPCEVPAGSRVGYPIKVLLLPETGQVTIEKLAFEGGKLDAIPMPGHHQRCAIWAAAAYGYGAQPLGPPGTGVVIRECSFRDWYGRAIALYHQVDGLVEGCTIERVADEGIDLDHFVERFTVRDNLVREALWGIVLNDASRCLVERNRIEGGEIGIHSWWYERTPRRGINEENVIRGNTVRGARQASIRVEATCVRYVIEDNDVDGELVVVEPENSVRNNVRTPISAPPR